MKGLERVCARSRVGGAVVESARVCIICTVTCIGSDASANLSSALSLQIRPSNGLVPGRLTAEAQSSERLPRRAPAPLCTSDTKGTSIFGGQQTVRPQGHGDHYYSFTRVCRFGARE